MSDAGESGTQGSGGLRVPDPSPVGSAVVLTFGVALLVGGWLAVDHARYLSLVWELTGAAQNDPGRVWLTVGLIVAGVGLVATLVGVYRLAVGVDYAAHRWAANAPGT
ncbi:hypothetical protein EXU48_12645 [Occultella glacieicola]|uniref:Uncharacterized protein n=1 Tax=Occultella glacieicola TaxID=2518684 RepID=A0ABY2E441_9MICO|nr:hypothetical protein [Occultella glacieicola]TDE94270.1 hypothetical protein EXU48_12645 [Occultella glacieicola]